MDEESTKEINQVRLEAEPDEVEMRGYLGILCDHNCTMFYL